MTTSFSNVLAREHVADLHRAAAHSRAAARAAKADAARPASAPAIVLRKAGTGDHQAIRDLAALDDAPVPAGEVLLALIDGSAVAAMSLRDGHVVANPFVHTQAAVELLRVRAEHLSHGRARRRRPFILRPRFA